MKKFLLALLMLMLVPLLALGQPDKWFYRRGFLSDSSRVNHLLEIGGPSGYGFLDVYGPSGTRSRISYPGTYNVNLYLPSTAGTIALNDQFGTYPIDFTGIGPGKIPIYNGSSWVMMDT